jgi:hypothetical protein
MSTPFFQVSRDAARALEEFSGEFKDALALGEVSPWSRDLGYVLDIANPVVKTTFPIPVDAAGYNEFKGDMKYRTLYHRSLSMKTKLWADGVEAPAAEIEAPDFIGWTDAPAAMAFEWMRQENIMVASMLEANPLLDLYKDPDSNTASTINLFSATHSFNVLDSSVGTFDNDIDTTEAQILSGEFFKTISTYFRQLKGPNGKPGGYHMKGGSFLVHSDEEQLFAEALERDTIINAITNAGAQNGTSSVVAAVGQSNRFKSAMSYVVGDELSVGARFYAIAAPKPGNHPWIVQKQSAPEEIVHDKTSDKYKDTGKVSIGYRGAGNAAGCLPQRIVRVTITG